MKQSVIIIAVAVVLCVCLCFVSTEPKEQPALAQEAKPGSAPGDPLCLTVKIHMRFPFSMMANCMMIWDLHVPSPKVLCRWEL